MSRGNRPTTTALVVLLVGSAITIATALMVRAEVRSQQRDELEQTTGEAQLLLLAVITESRSSLNVLANLPVAEPGVTDVFTATAQPLLTPTQRWIALVDTAGPAPVVLAAVGEDAAAGTPLTDARATLAERAAAAGDLVAEVRRDGGSTRLAFAMPAPDGDRVVVRESVIDPTLPVATIRGEVYGDIDLALYAGADASPELLVLKTAERVPGSGAYTTPLPVGADTWTVTSAPRDSLVGSFSQWAPWLTMISGVVVTVLVAGIVETLIRRRRYAEQLVEARTEQLEASLRDAARLEAEARDAGAAAVAANRSKSDFLSRMSHELRTPLNAVIGFAQILEIDDGLDPRQRQSVEQIRKGGAHLLDLVNEVLDIARIEAGTFVLSPEPVLASEVLGEALDLMRPIARDHRIPLRVDDANPCHVYVLADRQRVKQILLNLLSNAIKYNRVAGTVTIGCRMLDATRMQFEVTDTGPGIPPEQLDRLFQPFDRLDAQHSEVEGTGIGLALSRRLAEVMGGALDVLSSPGRGSTFSLALPLVEGPVERLLRLEPQLPGQRGGGDGPTRTIVYIEDNLPNLRLVERVIEHRGGVELVAAMQGRLGVDLVRRHQPAAVLLDLHLPDLSGELVLRELRDDPRTASIPVVILSADATVGQNQRMLAAGAHSFLTKPLDVRRLLAILDELISAADDSGSAGASTR